MSASATAQIIPFPALARTPATGEPTGVGPSDAVAASDRAQGQERLSRALASLDAALTEQRAAMHGWRESLDHLRKATTGLGLSMQRYHRTLGKLGTDVADLHAKSVQLEQWADDALKRRSD